MPKADQTIPELIQASLNSVDADVRPHLLNNVVVVGGASWQRNLIRRLDSDIRTMFPGPPVRLAAPSNFTERSFASWVGGSILASLGSFHQVSRTISRILNHTDNRTAVDLKERVRGAWTEHS
jgi:actin-related protein 4